MFPGMPFQPGCARNAASPDMADESSPFGPLPHPSESADPETFHAKSLAATPAQRIAWLEEALQLAYATGALKPRRFLTKEEWDSMGSSPQ